VSLQKNFGDENFTRHVGAGGSDLLQVFLIESKITKKSADGFSDLKKSA